VIDDSNVGTRAAPTGDRPPRLLWPPELWLLLVLAAMVRGYGLRFGMPHVWARPDELVVCDIARRFLTGDLNPHFWSYPTLFMYLLAALDYGFYLFGRASGWFHSLEHFVSLWHVNWTPFFMIARLVSATAGVATVLVVHRISTRLFDRLTAGIAALFLALAFLHVRDSHFGVTDVAMTFCVALSFLWLARGALGDRTLLFGLAGAAAGAGASIKYNVALMAAPLVAAVFVAARGRWTEAARRVGLFSALFVGAFLAGSPYAAIDRPSFMRGLLAESGHIVTPHGIDIGPGGIYHLVFSLRYGLGLPLLTAGLAGGVWLFKSDWRKAVLLGAFPAVYYLLLVPTRTVFVRYAIPLVPFLCISAAFATVEVARAIGRRRHLSVTSTALILALLVVAPSAAAVGQLDRLFAATDSRLLLADWIRANVKEGSTVYVAGNIVVQPIVDIGPRQTRRFWTYHDRWTFDEQRRPVVGIPEWLVIPETAVPQFSYCPPEVRRLALERYDVVYLLKAMELDGNLFDRQDAFFYPYAGFHGARRGGPNYVVYARRPEVPGTSSVGDVR
jgi:4-amino-4-deoxy-L-arabinose transferase-like glycosyltransferase